MGFMYSGGTPYNSIQTKLKFEHLPFYIPHMSNYIGNTSSGIGDER
jgi:hypothetical protein